MAITLVMRVLLILMLLMLMMMRLFLLPTMLMLIILPHLKHRLITPRHHLLNSLLLILLNLELVDIHAMSPLFTA